MKDPGARISKSDEVGPSWNRSISPNIQGQMKKTQNSMLSIGGTCGRPGLPTALLSRGGSPSQRPGESCLPHREGFDHVMPQISQKTREGPTGLHKYGGQSCAAIGM